MTDKVRGVSAEDRRAPDGDSDRYREGFADGLRWVLERFNLDTEDDDALNEALESGPWD